MADHDPYTGFEPMEYADVMALRDDAQAMAEMVRTAALFMGREVPLMAVAAGLISNPHRRIDQETVEEGAGGWPHRILVSRRLGANFVVCPRELTVAGVKDFLMEVGPDRHREELVIAALGFEVGFREALFALWGQSLTLFVMGGTEGKHAYVRVDD